AFGGMRLVANVISTSTDAPFDHPTTDGTEEVGEIVGENAEVTDQDPSFGSKTIGAYKYSSKEIGRAACREGERVAVAGVGCRQKTAYEIFTGLEFRRVLFRPAFGGMRLVANVISTSTGAPFDHPTTDGTEEVGEIVGENAEVTDQDLSFGSKMIGAYKYSSKGVAVPFELLQDTGIDLEAFIIRRLAMRLARITNRHFTVGTGVNQPEGIVTAAQVGVTGGAGQTDSVTWEDLVDLIHSVDP